MERYLQRRTKIKTPVYVKYKCSLEKGESSLREKRIAAITNPLIIPARIRLKKILSTPRPDIVAISVVGEDPVFMLTGPIPASIQADLTDLEVLRSGLRRTGAFFSVWSLATKGAVAISSGLSLMLLAWTGFTNSNENVINKTW